MTEKTLAKKLAEETFALYHTGYFNKSWGNDGKLIVDELEQHFNEIIGENHQLTFEVGEYYVVSGSLIANVLDTHDSGCTVRIYDPSNSKFWDSPMFYESVWGQTRKPATAEQIATFKMAEIKNDIEIIIKNGDKDWIEIVEDIEGYLAEELQEK
ncbi:hypothetical protein ACWOC1_10385 [Enterococcus quebecensis]|uniref:Uncharacterized protein n=1 Tax=Enterococcus quebecensis TaxID=903983 RepID=A0A1E5H236_9ENTE|nr:hypothetical protein [Enterococcus quebecensis]OEG18875.1 hypothetical protein BCR23_13120 [Enterococcus quebecensis]OJG71307.1 hypothetical protein RV12_GL001569 [Enterococcus quebecensis]